MSSLPSTALVVSLAALLQALQAKKAEVTKRDLANVHRFYQKKFDAAQTPGSGEALEVCSLLLLLLRSTYQIPSPLVAIRETARWAR